MTTQEYIDAAMKKTGSTSYYQLAKAIGISQSRISDYRKKRIRPDEYACTRLAVALGLDPVVVIGDIAIEFEKSAERREWWQGFLARAGRLFGIALMLGLLCMFISPNGLQAGTRVAEGAEHMGILCALGVLLLHWLFAYKSVPCNPADPARVKALILIRFC